MPEATVYSTDLIALAASLPPPRALARVDGEADRTSRLCGSRVRTQVALDAQGRLEAYSAHVTACALGQAAASILARVAVGQPMLRLRHLADEMRAMLKTGGAPPGPPFEALRALESVRDYPARHQSVLLPFETLVAALDAATGTPIPPRS